MNGNHSYHCASITNLNSVFFLSLNEQDEAEWLRSDSSPPLKESENVFRFLVCSLWHTSFNLRMKKKKTKSYYTWFSNWNGTHSKMLRSINIYSSNSSISIARHLV